MHVLSDQPFAATVVHVNEYGTINVSVLDHLGNSHFVRDCLLLQDDDEVPEVSAHCAWMPYQKVQQMHNQLLDAQLLASDPAGLHKKTAKSVKGATE
jgi:hypothetical protein